ncbi:MAG: hypothetical protein O3C51_02630 [Planctomycetota bacterium]|nr:hypothetical protein [Planctomycetota bacterium]
MNLLGLPPWMFATGLAGLAGTLLVLHMLRVRLRRQRVDSLLFFRQVGAVHRPRVLLGLPARLWSYLLGLALLAAAFTTFADPVDASDGPSRVVLVDASRGVDPTLRDQLSDAALAVAELDGLGPRGRVVAFGAAPRTVWNPTEPEERLGERLRELETGGAPDAFWSGLRAAASGLRDGDEIVVLGGPSALPTSIDDIPVRRAGFDGAATASLVHADVRHAGEGRMILVEASSGGVEAEVLAREGTEILARTTIRTDPGATTRTALGPIDDDAHPDLVLQLATNGSVAASVPFPLARSPIVRVHVSAEIDACVGAAIDAAPRLERAASPEDADVVVTASTPAAGQPTKPTLAFVEGLAEVERSPRSTTSNPLPMSLRDRKRAGTALPAGDGEVWVEDSTTGEALVRRGARGIEAVHWLLDDPSHRDVPTLICGSLLALAPHDAGPSWRFALPPAGNDVELALVTVPDPFPWALALLALALAALLVDSWLHHRGRVA